MSKFFIMIQAACRKLWRKCVFWIQHEYEIGARCLNGRKVCRWIFLDGRGGGSGNTAISGDLLDPLVVMSVSEKAQLLCESQRVLTAVCLISFDPQTNDTLTTSDTSVCIQMSKSPSWECYEWEEHAFRISQEKKKVDDSCVNSSGQIITINKNRQLYWLRWLLSSAQSSVVHYFRWIYSPVLTTVFCQHAVSSMPSSISNTSFAIMYNQDVCMCVWGG